MKVLWLLNMVLPSAADALGMKTSTSGSWLIDYSNQLAKDSENYELATMTYANVEKPIDVTVDGIRHFIFPGGGKRLLLNSKQCLKDCQKVLDVFQPDLIHIHGTEYAIGYSMLKIQPKVPVLLTIQGILTRIAQEYYGEIKMWDILRMASLKDYLKLKAPIFSKKLFEKNAKRERYVLRHVDYVTGRTTWDKTVMLSINDKLKYYRLNYNLREEFYTAEKWNYENAEKYTIYASAASYPLKGFHILIEALRLLKKDFPNVKVWMPGSAAKDGKLLKPGVYERYILKKIKAYGLEDNVEFVGRNTSAQVVERMQKANVCIVPSAIEGASATIREATMIGTPCVCSYRGGMTDLLRDGESGFYYDFPEYAVLAEKIKTLFNDPALCKQFSLRAQEDSNVRHDREKNIADLKEIYQEIVKK